MYKTTIFLVFTIFFIQTSVAQNRIPNTSQSKNDTISIKDIGTNHKGKLVARVALTGSNDATTLKGTTTNLLIYNTATAGVSPLNVYPGYYHNVGTTEKPNWKRLEVTVSEAVKDKQH